jgi:hypothetical protein
MGNMLPRSFHSGLLVHLILVATASVVSAQHYRIKDVFIGQDFFNSWTWETFQDPTHGRVNYVDQATAMAKNLSYGEKLKHFALTMLIGISSARQPVCDEGRLFFNRRREESRTR